MKTTRQTRLADRLPPGDDRMAKHDPKLSRVDCTAVGGRRGRAGELAPRTQRRYEFWLSAYQEWCRANGFQPELARLTDQRAEEWIKTLVVDTEERSRYAPTSVAQALSALGHWAAKAAVHPLPSLTAAYGVLHVYMDELANADVIVSRQKRTIKPPPPQDDRRAKPARGK